MIEDIIKMSLLAVLQGITEFLPVSSSGHLVLCKELLDFKWGTGATIEIMLHAGTLLSVILFYRRRLLSLGADLIAQKGGAVLWRLYSARCAPYFGSRFCIQGATGHFFSVSLGGIDLSDDHGHLSASCSFCI